MEGWDKVVPQFLREMLSSLDPKARDAVEELRLREGFPPVSYTHLTLPTT